MLLLAEQEVRRTRRTKSSLSVIMIDIDHFKRINDTYGHPGGDAVLREVAGRISNAVRDVDLVGRYGGEEFCVVLPDTPNEGVRAVAERIREAISTLPIIVEQRQLQVTASLGVSSVETADDAIESLIHRADKALYEAKAAGRNCVR